MNYLVTGPVNPAGHCARALRAQGLDSASGRAENSARGGATLILPPDGEADEALSARFEATRAALAAGVRLILQVVPEAGILDAEAPRPAMAALALSRSTALDLKEQEIASHAIAVEAQIDFPLLASLVTAIGRSGTLVPGQVFACSAGRIALLSQPRPLRVAANPGGTWSDADIGELAGGLWTDAFYGAGARP